MSGTQANIIIVLLGLMVILLVFGFAGVENELQRIRRLLENRRKQGD